MMVYGPKIGEYLVQNWQEANPVRARMGTKRFLQQTKEAARPWERDRHGAEFPKDAVPHFDGHAVLVGRDAVEEFRQASGPAGREHECHGCGVQDPTEDFLDGAPQGVALHELLDGDWFFAVAFVRVEWAEDVVDCVE
jgi:hypothetical protein